MYRRNAVFFGLNDNKDSGNTRMICKTVCLCASPFRSVMLMWQQQCKVHEEQSMNTARHQRQISMLMRISLLSLSWEYVYIQPPHYPLILPLLFLTPRLTLSTLPTFFFTGGSNPKIWSWCRYRKYCEQLLLPEVEIFSWLSANLGGRLVVFTKRLPVDLPTNCWIEPISWHVRLITNVMVGHTCAHTSDLGNGGRLETRAWFTSPCRPKPVEQRLMGKVESKGLFY